MNDEIEQLETEQNESETPSVNRGGRPLGSRNRKPRHDAYRPTGEGGTAAARPPELRIKLNEQGNVDVTKHTAESLDKIRSLLRNPETRQALGMTEEQLLQFVASDEDVRQFYQMIGAAECWFASHFRRIPEDIAAKHLPLKPDEVALVMTPTKAVAAKYIPASWMAGKDEGILLMTLFMLHRSKWADARAEAEKRRAADVYRRDAEETKEPQVIV